MSRLFYLLLGLTLLIPLPSYGDQRWSGATTHYPPYNYQANGQLVGLTIDIWNEVIQRLGTQQDSVKLYPWKRALHNTKAGSTDVLFNAGVSEDRKKWGRYSKHVKITQKYMLFSRKGEAYASDHSFQSLKNASIAIRRGFLYGFGSFKRSLTTPVFKEIFQTDSTAQSLRLLLNERVDLFVADYYSAMHVIKEQKLEDKVQLVTEIGTDKSLVALELPLHFLFSKKSVSKDQADKFDQALLSLLTDGTYAQILKKYNVLYSLN